MTSPKKVRAKRQRPGKQLATASTTQSGRQGRISNLTIAMSLPEQSNYARRHRRNLNEEFSNDVLRAQHIRVGTGSHERTSNIPDVVPTTSTSQAVELTQVHLREYSFSFHVRIRISKEPPHMNAIFRPVLQLQQRDTGRQAYASERLH